MEQHEAELTHVLAVNTHVQFPDRPPPLKVISLFLFPHFIISLSLCVALCSQSFSYSNLKDCILKCARSTIVCCSAWDFQCT